MAPEQRPLTSGGALLLQLGLEDDKEAQEQWQHAPDPGSESRTRLLEALGRAGTALREERFPARPGGWCDHCDFTAVCPAVGARAVIG